MERLDATVAGIGVLVVLVALAGAAFSPGAGAMAFQIGFPSQRADLPPQTGAIAGDGSTELKVQVAQANLTRVEFALHVSAAGPRVTADTITATLKGPGGQTAQATGSLPGPGTQADATLDLAANVTAPPPQVTVRAASAADALAQAGPGAANGTGTWTVHVGIQSQGGLGAVHTEGHDLTLDGAAFAWHAVVLPDQGPR